MKTSTFGKIIFQLGVLVFISNTALPQGKPYNEVSIASPTAGSLGKYADIPVNYHTGVPQISVPLYTVKAGPLELPISLSYHASGLKLAEPASWVGAGWSLNAGGVITRSVIGAPDEKGTGTNPNQTWGHFSEYGFNNYLYLSGSEDWYGFSSGARDGEPDLYFFNFGNYSGKFYFRDDRTPILVPQQDVKIVPTYTGTGSIQSFVITTPDGVQYIFGNTAGITGAAPVEITNPYTAQSGMAPGSAISSWYMSKIVSADGMFTISLNYVQENYAYYVYSVFPIDNASPANTYEYNLVKNIIQGVRLNQIVFPNGYVNFIAGSVRTDLSDNQQQMVEVTNTSAKSLGSIQVMDSSTFCKKFNFTYGYFTDNTTPLPTTISSLGFNLQSDTKRLRLDAVQEVSCDGTVSIPPRTFTYFSELVSRRLSFGTDHWGFMNGVTTNQKMIPTYTNTSGGNTTTVTGANRDAAWPAMRAGTLNKMTYSTGGSTTFDFEPNDTYTSYSQNVLTNIFGQSIGFDGSVTTTPRSFTADGNPFIVSITNNNTAFTATVVIKDASNNFVQSFGASPGTSTQTTLNLSAGNYTSTFSFAPSGTTNAGGAFNTFAQWQTQVITGNPIVGGLRIKTITHNEGSGTNNIITNYSYTNAGGNSNGVLFSRPVYVQNVRNDLIANVGYWQQGTGFVPNSANPSGCPGFGLYLISGGSIRPLATTQGNHVGYSSVKVSQTGNGYSIYNYYINSSGFGQDISDVVVRAINTGLTCDPTAPNYPAAPLPFDYKRGELSSEQHYNNTGQLLKDVYYYPEYDPNAVFSTPAFKVEARSNNAGGQILLATNYTLSAPRRTKVLTSETNYDPATGTSQTSNNTIYFGSPYHNEVTRKVGINSKGDSLITNIKYAFDFRLSNCDAISDCSQSYTTTCSNCLVTYNNAATACAGNNTCISNAYLAYRQCVVNARVSYVSCRRTNFTDPTNAFATCRTNDKSAADAELKSIIELQDENMNSAIETSNWRNANFFSSSFTRYDFASSPSTKVYPNKVQTINLISSTTTFTNAATNSGNNSIVKDSRYADETSVKFYNGNLVELKMKDGLYSSYIWGNNNTLPIVKASGVDFTTLKAAYDAVSGNLSTIRSQSSLNQALVNTYTYSPLIGMMSESDPNGKSISYEYDALARLKNIKDYQGNIVKNFQYNYANSCGPNCYVLPMQTLNGSTTLGYPVGVFNVNKVLLGNATTQAQYVSLWNGNTANQAVGVLSAAADPMQFNLTLNTGQTVPYAVTGLRYYQFDLPYTEIDGIRNVNGVYVDFGDSLGMFLGKTPTDTNVIRPANTTMNFSGPYNPTLWPNFKHTYPNSNLKTITIYHNDAFSSERASLDNLFNPATSLTKVKNLRGNMPQYMTILSGSCYQEPTMLSVASISNWSSINTVTYWAMNLGDGTNPCKNLNYAQDFMANNTKLNQIFTSYSPYAACYRDTTFKLSRLKSNWNTYFTELQNIQISDDHWNRESLSALSKLSVFVLHATTQDHTNNTSSPLISIPASVLDNIIIQISAGAGQTVSNGTINIQSGTTNRTTASDAAVSQLKAKGWTITINTTNQ